MAETTNAMTREEAAEYLTNLFCTVLQLDRSQLDKELVMSETVHLNPEFEELCGHALSDVYSASWAEYLEWVKGRIPGRKLLDFGCGPASNLQPLTDLGFDWYGLDVADPTDVSTRGGLAELSQDARVTLYDGWEVPLPDEEFDVVFSNTSLEHVFNPELSIAEMSRILKPGGFLVGQVTQLAPFHAGSTGNLTPYGFTLICQRKGLKLHRLQAQLDGISLICQMTMNRTGFRDFWKLSRERIFKGVTPFNQALIALCESVGHSVQQTNSVLLAMCGQYLFCMEKNA